MDIQITAIKLKKLVEFLDEVEGRLEELEGDILRLENSQDSEPLESMLRSIHTVWESASSFGLTSVQILSHEIETLLDTVRSRSIPVSTDGLIDTLLNGLDILAEIISEVRKAVAAADRSADPVTLTVNDLSAEESLAALRSFKKCTQAEETPEPSVAPLLTAEELEAICYPMDMDVLFVEESREHIEILEESLIELEEDINSPDLVNTIFRSLHSLKGSGGVLVSTVPKEEQRERHPITVLQKLAHAAEGAIQGVRDQKKRITPAMIDTLLQVVDRLKFILTGFVERDPSTAWADNLIMACRKISADIGADVIDDVSDDSGGKDADKKSGQKDRGERFALANTLSQCLEACEIGVTEISDPEKRKTAIGKVGRSIKTVKKVCDKLQLAPQAKSAEAVLDMVASLSDTEEAGDALLIDVISADCNTLRDDVLALVSENVISSPPPSQTVSSGDRKEDPPETAIASAVASTIKVPLERLDTLMNLVGELIVSKNSFPEMAREITVRHNLPGVGKRVKDAGDMVGRITDELQNIVMQMRMLPVGSLFSKYKRMVRDLSHKLDKKIVLKISGEETELDKTIIEIMGDPLVHLIRNCADHALEKEDERLKVGKPGEGTIHLRAYNRGHNVIIEVIDDGRGVDPQNIREKAVAKGYLSLEELEELDDAAVQNLIFRPGFSGAKEVGEVSGRGVGLDVVRTNVEKIGGTVRLDSVAEVGTTVTVTLPLTLAVSKGLKVKAGPNHYYLPLEYLVETIKISPEMVRGHRNNQMVVVRDDLLPVFSLYALLAQSEHSVSLTENTDRNNELSMVVINLNGRKVALAVDTFYTEREYVIKPLTSSLAKIPGLTGATITSSGQVILILDPLKLF